MLVVRRLVRFAAPAVCLLPLVLAAQRETVPSMADTRAWLTYLASDELQGRQVFSEGVGLAAAYIAGHLKEWGLEPAGDEGSYYQTVKVQGMRTRSQSSVTVTVNGQTRTWLDGQGVTFPRDQGAKQVVTGRLEFVGYGLSFAPLGHDDYAGRDVSGKVALYLGRLAPGMTTAQSRLANARAGHATDARGAVAAIGPVVTTGGRGRGGGATAPPSNPARTPEFQTARSLDTRLAPQITAADEFFEFVFSGSGHRYADLKEKTERQEPLPRIELGATIEIRVNAEYDLVQTRLTRNVVGVLRGSDPAVNDTYVFLGAHFDHAGYREFAPTAPASEALIADCAGQKRPTPRPGDIINNGADDNASGTVALMAIARSFALGVRPRRSVLFVWHTGEEAGLWGSRYMADHLPVSPERIAAQLNLDMVGRNRCDRAEEADTVYVVGSDRISTELHNLNEAANAALARPLTLDYELNDASDVETLYTRSDHYSYAAKGIPVIFFTTGLHRDYHFVTDEVDSIEFDKLGRIADLVFATAARVANLDRLPERDRRGPRRGANQTGPIR